MISEKVDELILQTLEQNIQTDKEFIKKIMGGLSTKTMPHTIVRNIYGITVTKKTKLGIYTLNIKNELIKHAEKTLKPDIVEKYTDGLNDVQIYVTVESVSTERAHELADEKYLTFEAVMSFLIGSKNSGYHIRIISPPLEQILRSWRIHENGMSCRDQSINWSKRSINISDEFFLKPEILEIFENINESKWPWNNIMNAMRWYSMALHMDSSTVSIVCYCTAIETLMKKDGDATISPSIVASISEAVAYMLGTDYKSRIDIDRWFRDVYGIRSSGVHSGSFKSDELNEGKACALAKGVINWFIDCHRLGISDEGRLRDWVKENKYSDKK